MSSLNYLAPMCLQNKYNYNIFFTVYLDLYACIKLIMHTIITVAPKCIKTVFYTMGDLVDLMTLYKDDLILR